MVTWKILYTDIKKQIVILNIFLYANSTRYYQCYEQIIVCNVISKTLERILFMMHKKEL